MAKQNACEKKEKDAKSEAIPRMDAPLISLASTKKTKAVKVPDQTLIALSAPPRDPDAASPDAADAAVVEPQVAPGVDAPDSSLISSPKPPSPSDAAIETPKQPNKRSRDPSPEPLADGESADVETPSEKKVRPDGFGSKTLRATECIICKRPRDFHQRGHACAMCQKHMRKQNVRSIQNVLNQEAVRDAVREASLKEKPMDDDADMSKQLESLQKMVLKIKRSLRK